MIFTFVQYSIQLTFLFLEESSVLNFKKNDNKPNINCFKQYFKISEAHLKSAGFKLFFYTLLIRALFTAEI